MMAIETSMNAQDETTAEGAILLQHGFDLWQESFNVDVHADVRGKLERAQAKARDRKNDADPVVVEIDGVLFQVKAHGARGGVRLVAKTPHLTLMLRNPMDWCLTLRASAVGLWTRGIELVNEIARFAERIGHQRPSSDWFSRVGRFDYAFDFYAPNFGRYMQPEIRRLFVGRSGVRIRTDDSVMTYGRGDRLETVTVGRMPGLQLTIYDKAREIRAIGLDWYDPMLRARTATKLPDQLEDIWRIEIRFGSDALDALGLRDRGDILGNLERIVADALDARRLVARPASDDTDRRRWPMHPLFAMAIDACREGFRPMVIKPPVTLAAERIERMLTQQVGGVLMAISVLKFGAVDRIAMHEAASRAVERVVEMEPGRLDRKAEILIDRYRFIQEAR